MLGSFNEAVNTATLNSTNVFLHDGNGSLVDGMIDYVDIGSDHLMTFTPSSPLDYNATYTFLRSSSPSRRLAESSLSMTV
ncbi:MAG: Ig-like domain-containing protein [Campylobacterales bacterium]|nr:Ig-like domain-containing protein [Campylobacterales bacterium]